MSAQALIAVDVVGDAHPGGRAVETAGIGDEEAWGEAEERVNGEYRIEDEDILAAIERTHAQEPELFAPTD